MSDSGDLHNFGRRVLPRVTAAGATLLEKPRPVFWEWLFFGDTSPLKSIFGDHSIVNNIFRLSFVNITGSSGSVKIVNEDSFNTKNNSNALQNFGALLFYAYSFGFEDLHIENLVYTDEAFQVVDLEVVCSDLALPNQTHLLPFKKVTWQETKLSQFCQSRLKPEEFVAIINGFSAGAFELLKNRKRLCEVMSKLESKITSTPIRVIIRPTREYTGAIPLSSKLSSEELVQIQRGDTPYFFTFVGSSKLFYYTTSDLKFAEVSSSSYRDIKLLNSNTVLHPADLLTEQNLTTKLANGLCYLANEFLPSDAMGEIKAGNLSISYSPDVVTINSDEMEISADRPANAS